MSGPPWIELHIADYMADTIGLSHREHGSYLLSIMAYWQKGEALTSKELNDVCGRDINKVSRFYVWENGKWHHSIRWGGDFNMNNRISDGKFLDLVHFEIMG